MSPILSRRTRKIVVMASAVGMFSLVGFRVVREEVEHVSPYRLPEFETELVSKVFRADTQEGLVFRLPRAAHRIKLSSFANLHPGLDPGAEPIPYRVFYEVESAAGDVILDGVWVLRSRLIQFSDPEAPERTIAMAHYPNLDAHPAQGKVSLLDLSDHREAFALRIRAEKDTPWAKSITIRVGLREEVPEEKADLLWGRLSQGERELLTRNRFNGLAGLNRLERTNLLRHRWKPLAPFGVEGRDFESSLLYQREKAVGLRRIGDFVGEDDFRIAPWLDASFRIPREGRLRIQFRSPGAESPPAGDVGVTIHGLSPLRHEESFHPSENELIEEVRPGSVVLTSMQPLDFSAHLETETGRIELAPEPVRVPFWLIDPTQGLRFPVREHQPFLIHFRAGEEDAEVELEQLNEEGGIVARETVPVPYAVSRFDFVQVEDAKKPVADPVSFALRPQPLVTELRLSAGRQIWATVYTRPQDLNHQTMVPQDYVDPDWGGRQPVWFGVRPMEADALARGTRFRFVATQSRPPEKDPDYEAGVYDWEDYEPLTAGLGQTLLVGRDSRFVSREEALPALFARIPLGKDRRVSLQGPAQGVLPERKLVFSRTTKEPVWLRVYRNGELQLRERLVTSQGEISLPRWESGEARIRVEVEPETTPLREGEVEAVRFNCYLNYVDPETASFRKIFAWRLQDEQRFEFEKSSPDELLTGKIYRLGSSEESIQLETTLEWAEGADVALSPSLVPESLTLVRRQFRIDPKPGASALVLGQEGVRADGGQSFFLPLGPDLKPGKYVLRIQRKCRTDAFLNLSKLTWGDYDSVQFSREPY